MIKSFFSKKICFSAFNFNTTPSNKKLCCFIRKFGSLSISQSQSPSASYNPCILPSVSETPKILPTNILYNVEAPAFQTELILEKNDPLSNLVPISEPNQKNQAPLYAGVRMLVIRRKKMRKFKRKKRLKRDHFILQKRHLKKKLKAESLFRSRMKELKDDLDNFVPLNYIKDIIRRAERDWHENVAPTGRRKYGHWSEVMSLEELYGIEKTDYINKRAGLITSAEDRSKFESARELYFKKYMRTIPTSSNKVANSDDNDSKKNE